MIRWRTQSPTRTFPCRLLYLEELKLEMLGNTQDHVPKIGCFSHHGNSISSKAVNIVSVTGKSGTIQGVVAYLYASQLSWYWCSLAVFSQGFIFTELLSIFIVVMFQGGGRAVFVGEFQVRNFKLGFYKRSAFFTSQVISNLMICMVCDITKCGR